MLYLNTHFDFIQCKLNVSNNTGQIVKQIAFDSSIGEQYIISLETLLSGIYTVSIIDDLGRILSSKQIVKK